MNRALALLLFACAALAGSPAAGQQREVPYWATMRAAEVNMRVGPSSEFPIDWVYRRAGLPVKVVRVNQGWRLIEDPDGARGWVVARLLSPDRGAIVTGDGLADMRDEPGGAGEVLWRAEPGVVGALGDCEGGWCRFDAGGRRGWIRQNRLWGAGEP
jgi:SH3-like domain-containing protein